MSFQVCIVYKINSTSLIYICIVLWLSYEQTETWSHWLHLRETVYLCMCSWRGDSLLWQVDWCRCCSLLHLITNHSRGGRCCLPASTPRIKDWWGRVEGSGGWGWDRWQLRLNLKWWRGGVVQELHLSKPSPRAGGQADSWPLLAGDFQNNLGIKYHHF